MRSTNFPNIGAKKEFLPRSASSAGGAWTRMKEKTKGKMKDIARDLIRLLRLTQTGKRLLPSPPDFPSAARARASFIYEDTPDQLKATQAVKADMESPRPMDRLYLRRHWDSARAEIAVRAAFKAAADGKQTAVLVPTTPSPLASSITTPSERLKEPAGASRVDFTFPRQKPKEVRRQTLADLEAGKIDILVGTHTSLSAKQ